MGIGKSIGEKLKAQNKTAAWLSKKTGIPATTIRSMITNDSDPKTDNLKLMADALGCSIFELIGSDYINSYLDKASWEEKRILEAAAYKQAEWESNRADCICSAAGYKWVVNVASMNDGTAHIIDNKTDVEYSVAWDIFNAAVNGSLDFIDFNFEKLIKSAKVVGNGKDGTEKTE